MTEAGHDPPLKDQGSTLPTARGPAGTGDPRAGNRVERDLLLAKVSASLLGESAPPTRVGRFAIVDEVGRGAMGIVYRAFDPKLDRKVAIKLVSVGGIGTEAELAQARLEREARAAADLSHPNVVTVYDVGRHEGQTFLAMEFVEGTTLTQWVRAHKGEWETIVEMFAQVGEGLAAAHAAGVVHGDFKPDNVIVGVDRRPRVADFGLARRFAGWTENAAEGTAPGDHSSGVGGSLVATTGTICGTPAYMAPEQFGGLGASPASDQFAYCISIYEALVGSRPFAGNSLATLASRVMSGERELPVHSPGLPASLLRTLDRGLALDPSARHVSVSALVDQLTAIRQRPRRIRALVGVAGIAVVALLGGIGASRVVASRPCDTVTDEIDAVWTAERQAALRDGGAQRVLEELDQYATSWSSTARDSCAATKQGGAQSEDVLQLRASCLSKVANRFDGIVAELVTSDASATASVNLAELLAPLSRCSDVDQLARQDNRYARASAYGSEREAGLAAEFSRRQGALLVRLQLGGDVRDDAEELVAWATENGLAAEGAESRRLLGEAWVEAGRADLALPHLDAALAGALEASELGVAAEASTGRAFALVSLGQTPLAKAELLHLEGYAASGVANPAAIDFRIALLRGRLAEADGDFAGAQRRYGEALEIGTRAKVPPHHLAVTRSALGVALEKLGQLDEGYAEYERALEAYGRDSGRIQVQETLINMGVNRIRADDYAVASARLEEAEALVTKAGGEESLVYAQVLGNRGWLERSRGNLAKAEDLHRRSLGIRERVFGESDYRLTYPLDELARIAVAQEKPAEALAFAGRARGILEDLDVAQNLRYAVVSIAYGEAQLALGDIEPARDTLTAALAKLESVDGEAEELARVKAVAALLPAAAEH